MMPESLGEVITFYSYKGGTGRSMALANVAYLLADYQSSRKGVLMIDWDLEAPGLHRFFRKRIKDGSNIIDEHQFDETPGLIDLFYELKREFNGLDSIKEEDIKILFDKVINSDHFILETDKPSLYLLKAGRFSEDYSSRVSSFNWVDLYEKAPWLIRSFAEYLSKDYDYILVDSRTGVTDISGITTMLMPDKLVVVFTPNRQSIIGVLNLVREASEYRKQSVDLRPLMVFPLPSRIEASEQDLRKKWRYGDPEQDIIGYQFEFEKLFKEIYDINECNLEDYFNDVQIQHAPHYAYGEEIGTCSIH